MKFTESLRKNSDFSKVYRQGRSKANYTVVLYVKENDSEQNRLGISVSKKVGNSVVRHRVKRLIKEAYRLNEDAFVCGYDLVFIARVSSKDKNFKDIEKSILHIARKMDILRKTEEDGKKDC